MIDLSLMDEPEDIGIEAPSLRPLLSDEGNQRLVREWIERHDRYTLADPNQPIETATFDCCILDGEMLRTHAETLRTRKREADPVLLPCLLLVPEADLSLIETDRGEIADSVVFETADEVVSMPIKKAELEWRIGALVRLRAQSLCLKERTEALELFKRAVEASGHAITMNDMDGTIRYANPAFESVTGYDRDDVIGESADLLTPDESSTGYGEELWDTLAAGNTWRQETTNERRDGSQYVADQTIAPIIEDGEPKAFVAVQNDITERKQLEGRLSVYRDIIERLDDPIMVQTRDGGFRLVNDALCSFAGLSRDELLNANEYAFMDPETATTIAKRKQEVMETEEPVKYSVEPTFEHSDKEAIFYTTRYPYYEDGDLAGTFAICRDVTDLEERTRQLNVFDNVLRHNIRNDLNVIHGRATQLSEDLEGEPGQLADVIVNRAEALVTTSEKSRDITSVLNRRYTPSSIDLGQIVQRLTTELSEEWPTAQIDVTGPDHLVVSAIDPIDVAIEELLANAVIHNDSDDPRVHVELAVDGSWGTLTVRDNGPGISEFDRDVLESGTAIETLSHGSGLGLWVVYWMTKRSRGTITVTTREPRGTEITIRLPLVPDEQLDSSE